MLGVEDGENGETLVKGYILSVIRGVSSGDLMHSIVIRVNNTALYTCNLLGVDLKYRHHTHTNTHTHTCAHTYTHIHKVTM